MAKKYSIADTILNIIFPRYRKQDVIDYYKLLSMSYNLEDVDELFKAIKLFKPWVNLDELIMVIVRFPDKSLMCDLWYFSKEDIAEVQTREQLIRLITDKIKYREL